MMGFNETETLKEKIHMKEEAEGNKVKNDPFRLQFHLMPPVGWMNDPNGLCQYQGIYHVFFQYDPLDAKGGALKGWGHYTSRDLLHWEYQGAPLLPDAPFDRSGVYSGSACVEEGSVRLYYTGNVKLEGNHDYITSGRLAPVVMVESRDGLKFSEKRVLLENKDYPEDMSCHVRDPKVWKEGNQYFMVLGARDRQDTGLVLVYRSDDGVNWSYNYRITSEKPFGYMWECPDLFCLNDQAVLSVSPQGLENEQFRYQNVYQSGYFLMKKEGEQYVIDDAQPFREWDMGFDFYAPQTFLDEKGRRILIGWAGLPDIEDEYTNPTVMRDWQHALTVPRELTFKDGQVYQYPVEELKMLRGKLLEGNREFAVPTCYDAEIDGITGPITVMMGQGLRFKANEMGCFMEFLDESGSGRSRRNCSREQVKELRILMDASLVEIYINGGQTVFTSRIYPEGGTRFLKVISGGETGIRVWEMADPENRK